MIRDCAICNRQPGWNPPKSKKHSRLRHRIWWWFHQRTYEHRLALTPLYERE